MRQYSEHRGAKARLALKLSELRVALIDGGFDTTAKQAAVLGVGRSTAWALLNLDKRAGPSASVIKRALSSPSLPPVARRKIEEYVREKVAAYTDTANGGRRRFANDFVMWLNATDSPHSFRTAIKTFHLPLALRQVTSDSSP